MAIATAPAALVARPVFERVSDPADEFRGRPGEVRYLEIPPRLAVMIDGDGPPGAEAFAPRMPGLYSVAFAARFGLKRRGIQTHVRPLEGLWWTASGEGGFEHAASARHEWRWTLLIVLPSEIDDREIAEALSTGRSRLTEPYASNLRIETFDEGRSAQIIHLGPYDRESPTIERLHAAIAAAGLERRGRHHEIYLGDPRRAAPDHLRTLIRQPVA